MTEQEWVERARKGDETAFEALVTAHEKRIYNLCRRLVGNPEDAAELTQEAFLNAWRGLARFQGEWVPLEDRYFQACRVRDCCQLVLSGQ